MQRLPGYRNEKELFLAEKLEIMDYQKKNFIKVFRN